jgi:hypothetical protein
MRKGLGECAPAAMAPAIVNAAYAGCGTCPTSVPMPEKELNDSIAERSGRTVDKTQTFSLPRKFAVQ